jgi:hypothetical protein
VECVYIHTAPDAIIIINKILLLVGKKKKRKKNLLNGQSKPTAAKGLMRDYTAAFLNPKMTFR